MVVLTETPHKEKVESMGMVKAYRGITINNRQSVKSLLLIQKEHFFMSGELIIIRKIVHFYQSQLLCYFN